MGLPTGDTNSVQFLFGHLATVEERLTIAIVMVIQTQYSLFQSALLPRVAENPGTLKNAHLP